MKKRMTLGGLVSVLSFAAPLVAQVPFGDPRAALPPPVTGRSIDLGSLAPRPNTYGTSDFVQVDYASVGFTPLGDGQWSHLADSTGWSYRVAGTNVATCTNIHFPSGAIVTGMSAVTNDTDAAPTHDIAYYVLGVDLATNTATTIFSFSTLGAPGIERLFHDFAPVLVVDNNQKAYSVCVTHATTGMALENAGATFFYRLQVSPAPATATFADVPVGSPQHRFVEALVSAGITAGCGGGNYCPTMPVTRGQMAVFLSVALGLHFPN